MRDRDWSAGTCLAEFGSAEELRHALRVLRARGYTRIESYSPVPMTGEIPYPRSRLPVIVFIVGLLGGVASYVIQWLANVHFYPLDIGGRPAHAVPAFIIPTFEGTVLLAALAAFVGFFVIARLPQPWHPVFEIDDFERSTVDRYWVAIDASDARHVGDAVGASRVPARDLRELAPLRVVVLETSS